MNVRPTQIYRGTLIAKHIDGSGTKSAIDDATALLPLIKRPFAGAIHCNLNALDRNLLECAVSHEYEG